MRLAMLLAAAVLPASAATTYVVTVAGLGGEPDYEQRFTAWAQDIDKTLKASGPDMRVERLSGANATKARLQQALAGIARSATAQDAVVLMLIGHGAFDGSQYKMNVPGPDVTSVELAAWLDRVPAGRQLVVNMTSASGAAVHALQKQNRTVITATKSGNEKNAPVFARYFIEALRDAAADADKNEVITALEAFRYAEGKTKSFYETNQRLATEHPMLDGGDQQATLIAGRFPLLRLGAMQQSYKDPAKQALLARREQLEGQIDQLKFKKASMATEEYRKQLSALLLELARTQEELDK